MEERTCRPCAQFNDDPAFIETAFPNINLLGSAYSSTRGDAGICQKLDRFHDPLPVNSCSSFTLRGNLPSHKVGE
jgi:hypothetical protein